MADTLSVLIPARNEPFLQKTIRSVLDAAVEDIEIVAVCDGYWPDPAIEDHPNVVVLHYTDPIGQRAAINQAARVAKGRFIMKLDAHCNVGPGFDKILKEDCKYEWTMVPRMYNLDPATWLPKKNKRTDYMYISSPQHVNDKGHPYGFRAMYFGHWGGAVTKKPKSDKLIDETMCCMGPGWFLHKDRFWEQGGCDENHGSWGQQGVEVSLKAWLSGGALMVNKKTWFAHWFRGGGQPVGFKSGFPYHLSQNAVDDARDYSRKLWTGNNWEGQKRPLQWLIDKFDPPTWNQCDLSVIIPSWKDPYLHTTIAGILANFETNFEIIPVLDGYEPDKPLPSDPRVKPLILEENVGMREAINKGVEVARGKYLMRSDEHCMFCKGLDRIVLEDIQDNHIVTVRRYFLDPEKWEVMEDKGVIDYEKLVVARDPKKFTSQKWDARTQERTQHLYDENMAMQGSFWIMPRPWWDKVIGRLQTEGYGPHYQDSVEMLFKTWEAGGKLMLSKKAWYAHRHRSFPRTHGYPRSKARWEWLYALNKWYEVYVEERKRWRA
jgi:glycosyltransferase involved in cell wall biosynthesis